MTRKILHAEAKPWYGLTDAATITVDASKGNQLAVTLGGNRTLGNPSNAVDGQSITIKIKQDATGGRTLAFSSNYRFGYLVTPLINTAANAVSYLTFIYNSADTKWDYVGPKLEAVEFGVACSDETSNLTTGTAKSTFRAPCAFRLTALRASVNTAPTGSTIIVDVNKNGTTVMSTNKLSIDASEKTSVTAATAAGITTTDFADDDEITIDIDQIGSTIAGKGLKVFLYGYKI